MPLQATSGAASYDAFGGGVAAVPAYIEEIFSTFLYTGNGSTQTITNNIDLSTNGGLVWLKQRTGANGHNLYDTARGATQKLASNEANESNTVASGLTSFLTSGFSLGSFAETNLNTSSFVSWTFRKQPKFFDVVTYTGNGASSQNIAHSLGSVPGCIIIKRTNGDTNWIVYHRSVGATQYGELNNTSAFGPWSGAFNNTVPTDAVFTVGDGAAVNASGGTYVAYLFAHDAGGFGLTGTDNVISCGSWAGNGSTQDISLGYEPQWILLKNITRGYNWVMSDVMRSMDNTNSNWVYANTTAAEETNTPSYLIPTATGFKVNTSTPTYNASGDTYIYIAIRRGPMKVPTTGTSVFAPVATASPSGTAITTGFPVDLNMWAFRGGDSRNTAFQDRLRGLSPNTGTTVPTLVSGSIPVQAEILPTVITYAHNNTGFLNGPLGGGFSSVMWNFRRAPGFFDEVCYTGTGSARTVAHNLAAVPELIISKKRSESTNSSFWWVYHKDFVQPYYALLNSNAAGTADSTALYASVGANTYTAQQELSQSSQTYVAYLFATCPGVSKIFFYTGNGSSQTINCGFTGGARFVMVKRTDSTGNWMVVDTARGLVSAGDPTLYLNNTAAEVTGVDWIDPDNSGFIVNQEGTMNANVSSATYIGLAIA
jgi:hypothetical protein